MDFERSKRQRRSFLRSGQRAADPKVGSKGSPLEEPDGSSGRRTETYRAKVCASPCQQSIFVLFCFVLETIRTSAMRIIHVIVKTGGTQRLRIKFVLNSISKVKQTDAH